MRPQDIVIGESYRLRGSQNYGWSKAIEVLKPKQGLNTHTYSIVKCEHSVNKNDRFGFIKYFRPCDMMKGA